VNKYMDVNSKAVYVNVVGLASCTEYIREDCEEGYLWTLAARGRQLPDKEAEELEAMYQEMCKGGGDG